MTVPILYLHNGEAVACFSGKRQLPTSSRQFILLSEHRVIDNEGD